MYCYRDLENLYLQRKSSVGHAIINGFFFLFVYKIPSYFVRSPVRIGKDADRFNIWGGELWVQSVEPPNRTKIVLPFRQLFNTVLLAQRIS